MKIILAALLLASTTALADTKQLAEEIRDLTSDNYRAATEQTIEAFKKSFSYTISVDGDDCDDGHDPLWLQYHMHALQYFSENPRPAKKGTIVIEVSSKAKKLTASVDKTGTVFKLTAPKEVAPAKWQDQMLATFVKAAKPK